MNTHHATQHPTIQHQHPTPPPHSGQQYPQGPPLQPGQQGPPPPSGPQGQPPFGQRPPAFGPTQPPQRSSRLPSAAETLGWGGGLTTLFGVVAVTWDFWTQIPDLALVALLVVASGILGIAATVVGDLDRRHDDRLAANLSVGLWWMTGIATSFTTYVAADVVSGGRAYLPLVAAAGAATVMLGAVAHRTGRDSALAGAILSAALTGFAAASLASLDQPGRAATVWAVGLAATVGLSLWSRADGRGSFATALTVLFGASQAVVFSDTPTIGVVLVLLGMITAASVAMWRRSTYEGITTGVLAGIVTCEVLYDIAPQVFNLSTTVLLAGIAMTAGCIHLVRRSTKDAGQ